MLTREFNGGTRGWGGVVGVMPWQVIHMMGEIRLGGYDKKKRGCREEGEGREEGGENKKEIK